MLLHKIIFILGGIYSWYRHKSICQEGLKLLPEAKGIRLRVVLFCQALISLFPD